eukprot:6085478-Alexandrium_andersonii.AAC.1
MMWIFFKWSSVNTAGRTTVRTKGSRRTTSYSVCSAWGLPLECRILEATAFGPEEPGDQVQKPTVPIGAGVVAPPRSGCTPPAL